MIATLCYNSFYNNQKNKKERFMGSFYFKRFYNPETRDEFFEFGIKDTDNYCEVELDGTLRFVPEGADNDFKKFVRTLPFVPEGADNDFKKFVRTFLKNTGFVLPRTY